ncbi:short-chain dehydrogenase [beta proteobacterium AAP121]|nr:short-chain dehydrogenase [beta proteobacterium AAP65]KPG00950.1 short-chain dehydrogenase [beta proteobacterium AAP121]
MKAAAARVLMTGASGGIGRAAATELRAAGAQVVGVGRGAQAPAGVLVDGWVQADLNTPEGVLAVAQAAATHRSNVVVLAAGQPCFGAFAQTPAAEAAAVLHSNLLAPLLLVQALLPQLQRLPAAQIVFVGSALGRIGVPGYSVYGASKAGLHGFAEALRRELAGGPVHVQTLAPRATRTAFNSAEVLAHHAATGTASDSPETVARALLGLIESGAAERYIGAPERLAVRLNGLLGALLDGSFAAHRRSLPGPAGTATHAAVAATATTPSTP